MASNANPSGGPPDPNPNQKTVNLWSKPIQEKDAAGAQPTISEAVGMIKPEDFTNVANTPCARNGLLTGIGTGFGAGGLRFILGAGIPKATNWAAGFFILGSAASYEYCQYKRRCEKRDMKRHVEVINQSRKEQARKLAEAKWEEKRKEEERMASQKKPWYKFW